MKLAVRPEADKDTLKQLMVDNDLMMVPMESITPGYWNPKYFAGTLVKYSEWVEKGEVTPFTIK